MPALHSWIPSTEVAFIAQLSDKEINRAVDEDVLPTTLYQRTDGRRFARITAVFAKFYFDAAEQLTRTLRREVIETLTSRLMQRPDHDAVLELGVWNVPMDWKVQLQFGWIDLERFVKLSKARAARLDRAHRTVVEDSGILGGMPVFAGTRIPIEAVLASKNAGMSAESIAESYPSVTPEQIDDAEAYLEAHPRRGRPRKRLDESSPHWRRISHKVVVPPKTA
ncbi:MAG: DUF433 domain-containing protein [Nevskia sp.]|nr:DUF433 domain-containing protein [Nevskia sp.]